MPNTNRFRTDVTVERLRSLLVYHPTSGVFTWRADHKGGRKAGDVAGTPHSDGYTVIGIDGVRYLAHRLAILYVTGEWPRGVSDHKDRDRSNTSADNLRSATQAQNVLNSTFPVRDLPRGVYRKYRRFIAITTERSRGTQRSVIIGRYDTPEEAHQAWREYMARRLGAEFLPSEKEPCA